MVQNETEIFVKDNSGALKGRCINAGKQHQAVGAKIQIAILKTKAITKKKGLKRKAIQDLLLIQTKKTIVRNDGSTIAFNGNKGVCVSTGARGLQLGFKRINTSVPLELRRSHSLRLGLSPLNLMKLAKNVL